MSSTLVPNCLVYEIDGELLAHNHENAGNGINVTRITQDHWLDPCIGLGAFIASLRNKGVHKERIVGIDIACPPCGKQNTNHDRGQALAPSSVGKSEDSNCKP